ncbi:MAG: hypothetical protein ABIC04_03425 [Nanoarchaeota archaeon]
MINKELIALTLIWLVILMPITSAEIVIRDVTVEDVTDSGSNITWNTDISSTARVTYGKTVPLSENAYGAGLSKNHSVIVEDLDESTPYLFEVYSLAGSNSGTDNNNGQYYQFTTLPDVTPNIKTFINRYQQTRTKQIELWTDPNSEVEISVNNGATDLQRSYADPKGFFSATVDLLDGDNTLKVKVEDPRGHKNETEFIITVDQIIPSFNIRPLIPPLTAKNKILVNGTVDENVTMNLTLEYQKTDTTPPAKVINLTNVTIDSNSVELEWNKITDAEKYLVYRDNYLLSVRTTNQFTDQVNTSTEYTYSVSAVDASCNQGEGSDELVIKTQSGANNVTATVTPPQSECGFVQEVIINTKDFFKQEFTLKDEGFYMLTVEAKDPAGNMNKTEFNIYYDVNPPEITDIEPPDGTDFFEQFADDVDITGKTDPGAKVYLYVKRTPMGEWNTTMFERIADQINTIAEEDLSTDSDRNSRADYMTLADANGNFLFPKVDIRSSVALGGRVQQINYEDLHDLTNQYKEIQKSNLLFIATDAFQKRGYEPIEYDVKTCWSGDMLWDATPLLPYQSPAFISTERLAEGLETLYFYFNFTYYGDAVKDQAEITSVTVERACDEYIVRDPNYNHSCNVMGSSAATVRIINGKTAYVVYRLSAYKVMDQWSSGDWNNFFKGLTDNQMLFPLRFTIQYKYKKRIQEYDTNGIVRAWSGQDASGNFYYTTGTQRFCESVGYYVDMGRIDPRDVLPDWLLYDFVDILEDIIEKTTEWIDDLGKILEQVAMGCMISYFGKFFIKVYRNFNCRIEGIKNVGAAVTGGGAATAKCKQCIQDFDYKGSVPKGMNIDVMKPDDISDTCLKECYPGCYSAWQTEATWHTFFRYTCDRLFGHSSPAGWTEDKSNNEILKKIKGGSQCDSDQSTKGRRLTVVNCREAYRRLSGGSAAGGFGTNDECVEMTGVSTGVSGAVNTIQLYKIGNAQSSGSSIYNLIYQQTDLSRTFSTEYAIKQSNNYYLTYQPKTCAEICGAPGSTVSTGPAKTVSVGTKKINIYPIKPPTTGSVAKTKDPYYTCTIADSCKSLNKNTDDQHKSTINDAFTAGYTNDCFYKKIFAKDQEVTNALDKPQSVSGKSSERYECCCISAGENSAADQYYQPQDVESKTKKKAPYGVDHAGGNGITDPKEYADMEWSYRYFKINWAAPASRTGTVVRDQYNPDRYTSGRDAPACFGQDHLWGGEEVVKLDPARDFLAAFQCADVGGILNRLYLVRNLATALKTCLMQVRTTGRADSGMCKEMFTQYICSFIWKVIVWVRDGCSPMGSLLDADGEAGWSQYIVAGVGSMVDSVQDSQLEMAQEYGNADINSLFGMGEEAVARKVCLAAFGYDWDIGVQNFVDAAYAAPYETLVMAPNILQGREYLTFDPTTSPSQSVYEYKNTWTINPGCNFDGYRVYLTCIGSEEFATQQDVRCDKVESPQKPDCPCANGASQSRLLYTGGALTKNVLEDIDHTMIPAANRIVTSPYRYDHIKIEIDAKNIAAAQGDVNRCFGEGHVQGTKGVYYFPIKDYTPSDFVACEVDAASGTFYCNKGAAFLNPYGTTYLTSLKVNNKQVYPPTAVGTFTVEPLVLYAKDDRTISGTVNYYKDDKAKCLVVRLTDSMGQLIGQQHNFKLTGSAGDQTRSIPTINIGDQYTPSLAAGVTYSVTSSPAGLNGEVVNPVGFTTVITKSKSITFQDGNSDNKIELKDGSVDKFKIDGSFVPLSTVCASNICTFALNWNDGNKADVKLIYTEIAITQPETEKVYSLTITKQPMSSTTPGARFGLHIDLRNPVTENGDCAQAAASIYDDSLVVVNNGIRQWYDVPIQVLAGSGYDSQRCAPNMPISNDCYCAPTTITSTTQLDCPKATLGYYYCVDSKCRRYNKCTMDTNGEVNNGPCVCGVVNDVNKFDCGYTTGAADNDYAGTDPTNKAEYQYCSATTTGGSLSCKKAASAAVVRSLSTTADTTMFNTLSSKISISTTLTDAIAVLKSDYNEFNTPVKFLKTDTGAKLTIFNKLIELIREESTLTSLTYLKLDKINKIYYWKGGDDIRLFIDESIRFKSDWNTYTYEEYWIDYPIIDAYKDKPYNVAAAGIIRFGDAEVTAASTSTTGELIENTDVEGKLKAGITLYYYDVGFRTVKGTEVDYEEWTYDSHSTTYKGKKYKNIVLFKTVCTKNINDVLYESISELPDCTTTPACFLPQTKITMADNSKKEIQDIIPGDRVISYDLENNMPVESEVLNTFVHPEYEYLVINDNIKVTPYHYVYAKRNR